MTATSPNRNSLATQALTKISIGITALILLSTGATFLYFRNQIGELTKIELASVTKERIAREQFTIDLIESKLAYAEEQFLSRLEAYGDSDPVERFNEVYQLTPEGVYINSPEYPYTEYSNTMIRPQFQPVDAQVRRTALIMHDLLAEIARSAVAEGIANNAWYIAEGNFSGIYLPSYDFYGGEAYEPQTTTNEAESDFYVVAKPENNPSGEIVYTEIYFYEGQEQQIFVNPLQPIYIDGEFWGAITLELAVDELASRTINETLENSYNLLFEQTASGQGKLVAHPELMEEIRASEANFIITEQGDENLQRIYQSALEADLSEGVKVIETSDDLVAVGRIEGPNWYFATVFSKAQLQAQAGRAALITFGLGLVTLGTAVAILWWVMNKQVRDPLEAVTGAVQKIGGGDLNTRLQVEGSNELAILGTNINSMAEQLEKQLAAEVKRNRQQNILARVTGGRVESWEDLDTTLNTALGDAREFLDVDRAVIYRPGDNQASGTIANEAIRESLDSLLEAEIEDSAVPASFKRHDDEDRSGDLQLPEEQPELFLAIADLAEAELDPDLYPVLERLQASAAIAVPIFAQGQIYGLLVVADSQGARSWENVEISFLRELALQMGIVIDRLNLAQLQGAAIAEEEQRKAKDALVRRALELLQEVDPISQGDLSIRATVTDDEIGTLADSYNSTVESLREIVAQVQVASQEVEITTRQNSTPIEELSAEARQQVEAIAKALEQIQQMAALSQDVSSSARKAESAVKQTLETVEAGDAAMNRTVEGIAKMNETVTETTRLVQRLGDSSQRISKVVNLISSFAAQTNILSLNASIEAARAGEEGRGFAVVAEEVRALAQQSADATAEIGKIVEEIQVGIREAILAMEAGTQQVSANTQTVEETRQSLNRIVSASNEINQLVEAISKAASVQTGSSEEVSETISTVAQRARKTSTSAETVSESFGKLISVAERLQDRVRRFKLQPDSNGNGNGSAAGNGHSRN